MLVIVWLLLLPPFALLRGGSDQAAGDGYSVRVLSTVPALPGGLAPASRYYQVTGGRSSGAAVDISLPLLDPKAANRGLEFYTYLNGGWQQLAAAEVGQDGQSAQGEIQALPSNLILLKRQLGSMQIFGSLPAGKTLSPEAAQQIAVLNPSGFIPNADGSLTGSLPPSTPGAQYDVVPAVVALTGDPVAAVTTILSSTDKETAHLTALTNLANQPGDTGVELDYLAVPPQGRQAYTDFVAALAQNLHRDHHVLGVEMPAPTLTGGGWSTGAYDWTAIARVADYVKLQPDPDQSLYRKQMPDLLRYLTAQLGIDPRKLVLVTSPYSVEKTETATREITRLEALSIASQIQISNDSERATAGSPMTLIAANLDHDSGGSGLVWDSSTASVSFVFHVGDATHVVWIQNGYSEGFKLEYAQLYHLGGVAVSDASNDPAVADLWPAISHFVAAGSPILLQPNPELLVPSWQADGRPLQSDGKTSLAWTTPPDPGLHTITLTVSDGDARVVDSLQIRLEAGQPSAATPSAGRPQATATPRAGPLTATPVSTRPR